MGDGMNCPRVPHATVKADSLAGKVAWLLQDLAGVKGPDDFSPALDDEDALFTARAVIELIDAERALGTR